MRLESWNSFSSFATLILHMLLSGAALHSRNFQEHWSSAHDEYDTGISVHASIAKTLFVSPQSINLRSSTS